MEQRIEMRVFLETVGETVPWHDQGLVMRKLAEGDDVGRHSLSEDRKSADILLAVFNADARFTRLKFDKRRFGFCTYDVGFPMLPGLYPSLPRWNADPRFARSAPYLPKPWDEIESDLYQTSRPYLFSFVGSILTSPLRKRILKLRHARSYLEDTSGHNAYKGAQPQETYKDFLRTYRQTLADSKFVLCPRGLGVSSVRLFETMRAGRVPVVISDDWVPPMGVPWDDFIVRVAEKDISTIPQMLDLIEDRADDMGETARRYWEENFSEKRVFDWMMEQLVGIGRTSSTGLTVSKWKRYLAWRNFRGVKYSWISFQANSS